MKNEKQSVTICKNTVLVAGVFIYGDFFGDSKIKIPAYFSYMAKFEHTSDRQF